MMGEQKVTNYSVPIIFEPPCISRRSYCTDHIQGVPKPMAQTSHGYSPPLIKQKSSYQHGSKSERVPRYPLTFMRGYPLSIT